ncbi:hypothetical protein Glove_420g120 [Diversispora epigaea]|uniref:Protein kinase domain-containing protein n=1 Tax=Diversispora epigaea TaxID=1348612 RepID=A0A397H166_9GLOM|nr:hypothetical protein Glove_420g120 [Diversispora epigaea]
MFVCPECNQGYAKWRWCKPCNSTRFKNDFDKWTSGNDTIDKFIQDTQLNADYYKLLEWIPYDRFQDIKQIAKGGYGTIYYAMWADGYIISWDIENQRWKRSSQLEVALKKFNSIVEINEDFLNEMAILLRTNDIVASSVVFYDFGLSKLITENIKNRQKNTIPGVLPYIAPEVLVNGEYTKAVDVYSFAFVAYEIVTLLPPYHDVSHDKDLAFKICNGFRPKIPFHTPKLITQIIMRCWDARITHRPTFEELEKELGKYYDDYRNNNNEITIQIKEEFSKNQTTTTPLNYKTHPQAIYTSRLLNFSNLPKPKNDENFEKKLEELTKSFYQINSSNDDDEDLLYKNNIVDDIDDDRDDSIHDGIHNDIDGSRKYVYQKCQETNIYPYLEIGMQLCYSHYCKIVEFKHNHNKNKQKKNSESQKGSRKKVISENTKS